MQSFLKFVIIFLFLLDSKAFAQNKFIILGTLPSNHDEVELDLAFGNSRFPQLTATSQNGKFQLSGEIKDEFERVRVTLTTKDGRNLGGSSFFIKAGNMKLIVEQFDDGNDKQFKAKYFNMPFIKEQKEYADLVEPITDSMGKISKLMFVNEEMLKKYDQDSLQHIYNNLRQERTNIILQLATKEHTNYWGLYIFNNEIIERMALGEGLDTLLSLYNGYDRSLKNTQLGKSVETYLRRRQSLLIGKTMPDFSFITNEGQLYTLASFQKENYVLLCFWSSGCVPCVKSIPMLKEIAKEYETRGLQLISVSSDLNESTWLNSLKRHEMTWLQTCDLPQYNKGIGIAALYDLMYIPQYFLIDIEGKLIYQSTQSKDTNDYTILKMKLKELFN